MTTNIQAISKGSIEENQQDATQQVGATKQIMIKTRTINDVQEGQKPQNKDNRNEIH